MTKKELEIAAAACCVGTIWDQYEGTEMFNEMDGKRVQHLIELVRNHLEQEQPPTKREIAEAHHYAEMIRERDKARIQQEQPEVDIVPLQEEKMVCYINYCLQREDDDCICPNCGKYVTGLRLFPYYYDRENNDVYFASVCPECGKIIISKE